MIALGIGLSPALPGTRVAGGETFDPTHISSLSEWFDYRNVTVAGVGDGNPVSAWPGEKALYTLAASGTARPTYVADDGDGRASVQADGVNDCLRANIVNAALLGTTGDNEVWCVFRMAVTQVSNGGVYSISGASNQMGLQSNGPTSGSWYNPSGPQGVTITANLQDNAWHVVRLSKTGARRLVQIDGVTVYDASTTVGPYYTGVDTLNFMAEFDYYFMSGASRHLLFFTEPLNDVLALKLNTYLQSA